MWIDAICIDQSSKSERSHQITLMTQIYSQAAQVVVYLGEETEDSSLAIKSILRVEDLSEPLHVEAILIFFQRPWFTRMWVIQEVLFARAAIVVCGSQMLYWERIRAFGEWDTWNSWRPTTVTLPMVVTITTGSFFARSTANPINGHARCNSFIATLNQAKHCRATDPLDKVYALLPLLTLAGFDTDLVPNYEHSPARVYTDFSTIMLEQYGIEWLEAVEGRSSLEVLPTWVPDWTLPFARAVLPRPFQNTQERTSHCSLSIPHPIVRRNYALGTTCLETTGRPYGRIKSISCTYISGPTIFPPVREWRSIVAQAFGSVHESDYTWEARWRSQDCQPWEKNFIDCILTGGTPRRPERILDYVESYLSSPYVAMSVGSLSPIWDISGLVLLKRKLATVSIGSMR
jgi:hypothetical protein